MLKDHFDGILLIHIPIYHILEVQVKPKVEYIAKDPVTKELQGRNRRVKT